MIPARAEAERNLRNAAGNDVNTTRRGGDKRHGGREAGDGAAGRQAMERQGDLRVSDKEKWNLNKIIKVSGCEFLNKS